MRLFKSFANHGDKIAITDGENIKLTYKKIFVELKKIKKRLKPKSLVLIVSENTISDNSIEINQIEGPFDHFKGIWTVKTLNDKSCSINFDAEFELPFLLNAITSQALVDKFSSTIIESFINRAT